MVFDINFLFLFVYLVGISVLFHNVRDKRLLLTILLCAGPFLLLALRSPYCGRDLLGNGSGSGYYHRYVQISAMSWWAAFTERMASFEQGFVVFNKFVSIFSDIPQFFLAFIALVSFGLIGSVFYKYSDNLFLSIIIYVCLGLYVFSFSGIRQAIAFSITFYAFHFVVERRLLYFILAVLIATSMHKSAIVYFFVWPLWNIKLSGRNSIIMLVLLIVAIPFYRTLFSFIVPILFGEKYLKYMNNGSAINLALLYILFFLLSFVFKGGCSVYVKNTSSDLAQKKYHIYNFIKWMVFLTIACQSLGVIGGDSITRIAYYFSIYLTLYIPSLISKLNNKNRLLLSIMFTAIFIAFFYYDSSKEYYHVVPYYFVWELFV